MNLRQQQNMFVMLVGKLIEFAYQAGYELSFGEAYRTPQQASWNAAHKVGISRSLHTERLAIDFNLFKGDKYLGETNDHLPLGEFWEKLHPLCRWGGRFGDGNHYSMEYNGVK